MSDIPIIIPWFGIAGEPLAERSRIFDAMRTRWSMHGFTVVESGGASVAAARNRAADAAGGWDVAVFVDADVMLTDPVAQVAAAADLARTGVYACCYSYLWYLDERATKVALELDTVPPRHPVNIGRGIWEGCFAIGRPLWERLGGFDERFGGRSGCEGAFIHAAYTFGGLARVDGDAFHLHHPPSPPHQHAPELWNSYRDAEGDPEAMSKIIDAWKATRA